MRRLLDYREHLGVVRQLVTWTALVVPVGVLVGSASALFLWSLDHVTEFRWQHSWLLCLLPLAGLLIALLYQRFGKSAERGNNLIIEQIHELGGGVPARMAPLVFVGTLLTHLFGGSAGREGTAVQMGGSLASAYGRLFRIGEDNLRVLLMAGVAAGFGSVFGTPLAGAIFAMEVLVIGQIQYEALIPVLVASLVGDAVCSAWGVHHTMYHIKFGAAASEHAAFDGMLLGKVLIGAMAFGLASQLFAEMTHALQHGFKRWVKIPLLRPMLGGAVVIGLVYLVGTQDFLGLGVRAPASKPHAVSILSAFEPDAVMGWGWWWKTVFTAVTLASGFKGGEVTPLFFIGATLGHALARLTGAPVDLFASLGFVGVFAGAANTPLACTVMGAELFGAHYILYFAVACFVAYFFSGHSGIYMAQRVGVPKRFRPDVPPDASLQELRELHRESARGLNGFAFRLPLPDADASAEFPMNNHHIATHEMGKIRMYMTPKDRVPARGFMHRLNGRQLYRAIINAAKQDGIKNAVAFMTHYGFTNNSAVQQRDVESVNPALTLCVEIIDHRDVLEKFCRKHGDLIQGKTIVYKHVEHWTLKGSSLVEEDASPNEVIDGNNAKEVKPKAKKH